MEYCFESRQPFPLLEGHLKMGETNPNGERIDVNNLYLTIDNKPCVPVMAEIHISRTRRKDWEDRILKMKANGINIISSYLFWIKHEPIEGQFNFEGENDIKCFIELCKKHGMYFALRIGPWITAECRNGGLPEWLYFRGIPLRQNDPEYLFYVRRWYEAVYNEVKDLLYKNGGNIILIQFDNEITGRPEHLMALKDMALEIGISAPVYTATGWNLVGGAKLPKDEMIPVWGGYAAKPWTPHTEAIDFFVHFNFSHERNSSEIGIDQIKTDGHLVNLPDDRYPYFFAEMGTGLCNSKHRRPLITDMDNYSFALCKLGSGNNMPGYYLFAGGKNELGPGYSLNWSNEVDKDNRTYAMLNYDFEAPIATYGNIRDSYRLLKMLNLFTNNYGESLAPMQAVLQETVPDQHDTESLRYSLRTENGNSGYIFVNNHIHNLKKQRVENVQFTLPNGKTLPEAPITVNEETAFFFPFGVTYGIKAEYVTAQPLCKKDNTYFFLKIDGIEPIYKFDGKEAIKAEVGKNSGFNVDGYTFITLTKEEAMYLYQFGNRILIGDNCDLVINGDSVTACNEGTYSYYEYKNGDFEYVKKDGKFQKAEVSIKEVRIAPVDPRFFHNLHNMATAKSKRRKLHFFEILLSGGSNGYLYVDYSGDSAQIYTDGEIYDEHFYNGMSWILPVSDLKDKKLYMVIAEYTKDIYVDIEPKTVCSIDSIEVKDR